MRQKRNNYKAIMNAQLQTLHITRNEFLSLQYIVWWLHCVNIQIVHAHDHHSLWAQLVHLSAFVVFTFSESIEKWIESTAQRNANKFEFMLLAFVCSSRFSFFLLYKKEIGRTERETTSRTHIVLINQVFVFSIQTHSFFFFWNSQRI